MITKAEVLLRPDRREKEMYPHTWKYFFTIYLFIYLLGCGYNNEISRWKQLRLRQGTELGMELYQSVNKRKS